MIPRPPISTRTDALCPSTPLFRSLAAAGSYPLRAFSLAFASWWIHVYASIQALRRRPSRFVVTPKRGTDGRQLKAVWPSLVALVVLTAAIVGGLAVDQSPGTLNNAAFAGVHLDRKRTRLNSSP